MAYCNDADGNPIPCPDDGETGTGSTPTSTDNIVMLPDTEAGNYTPGVGWVTPYSKPYTAQQASAYLLRMSSSEQARLGRLFKRVAPKWGFESQRSMWNAFVQASVNTGQTPWQLMEEAAQGGIKETVDQQAAGAGSGSGSGGPYRRTYVDLTNPTEARRLVDDTLGSYLGRRATEQEAATFYSALTAAQKENPAVVQGYSNGGSETSVRTNAVDQQQLARDFARSRPDYAEVTTQTTVKSLIEKAIREADQNWVA